MEAFQCKPLGIGIRSFGRGQNRWIIGFGSHQSPAMESLPQMPRSSATFHTFVPCSWMRISVLICLVCFLLVLPLPPAAGALGEEPLMPNFNVTEIKLKRIGKHLKRLNKPALKTIQSPDGDTIDCVLAHQQPAFDHPRLKGLLPLEPPVRRPKGYKTGSSLKNFQPWHRQGKCPKGTVPIRRTKKEDVMRFGSVKRFGRKPHRRPTPWNPTKHYTVDSGTHEHSVGFVSGDQYYGAKASLNVWTPHIQKPSEFSLSQMWVISGTFDNDLNTIEAGWQVSPELYGDSYPRFFTYWTTDAYQATGCYNLLCSGFVQTNNEIAIGAAISPTSQYNGGQFDISLLVWKDPNHGNWWLEFGDGQLVGYWPAFLFSHLADHATMVQWGGEIVNTMPEGMHTSTQMGSGHFAEEGFSRASYFRNIQVVDWDNSLIPLANLQLLSNHPECYDIQGGQSSKWGNYFYYGGPGRNPRCP